MKLPGIKKLVICDKSLSSKQIAAFARAWLQARAMVARRGMGKLAEKLTVVLTSKTSYYARFYSDDVMYANVPQLIRRRDAASVIVHELAHRVWFCHMTPRTRARWEADHTQRRARKLSLPSGYAHEGAAEDHAESFRMRTERTLRGSHLVRYVRLGPDEREIAARLR